jgi:phosphoribosylformylglycinamidine cyclo-ligase
VLSLLTDVEVKGMAHITGGGLIENTHRMFPENLAARIDSSRWPRPAIFDWLQRSGNIAPAEMPRVFNCGIGFILVVAREHGEAVRARLAELGETAYTIGRVERRPGGAPGTVVA